MLAPTLLIAILCGDAASVAWLLRREHFEEQNEFIRLNRVTMKQGDEPDIWLWARLTHVDPEPFTSINR